MEVEMLGSPFGRAVLTSIDALSDFPSLRSRNIDDSIGKIQRLPAHSAEKIYGHLFDQNLPGVGPREPLDLKGPSNVLR